MCISNVHNQAIIQNHLKYYFTQENGNKGDNRDKAMKALFTSEDIIRKGILADEMYMTTSSKEKARRSKVKYVLNE